METKVKNFHEIVDWLNDLLDISKKNAWCLRDDGKTLNAIFRSKGKTDNIGKLIRDWAKENSINLFVVSPSGKEFPHSYKTDRTSDLLYAYVQPEPEVIKQLDQPNTVMLLENIDQMTDKSFRRRLLDVMNRPYILNSQKEEELHLLDYLDFTIATVGPMGNDEWSELTRRDAKDSMGQMDVEENQEAILIGNDEWSELARRDAKDSMGQMDVEENQEIIQRENQKEHIKKITVNQMKEVLDAAVERINTGKERHINILFIGNNKIGKSKTVKTWSTKHSDRVVNEFPTYFYEDGKDGRLIKTDIVGFPTKTIEQMKRENSILILDSSPYKKEINDYLVDLILYRKVENVFSKQPDDLDNLSLVVAINPPADKLSRMCGEVLEEKYHRYFEVYEVNPSASETKDYICAQLNDRIKLYRDNPGGIDRLEKQKKLINYILSAPDFKFDFCNPIYLSPARLYMFLKVSDGTKSDFLRVIKDKLSTEAEKMLGNILEKYED